MNTNCLENSEPSYSCWIKEAIKTKTDDTQKRLPVSMCPVTICRLALTDTLNQKSSYDSALEETENELNNWEHC
jgi:hypothetical protein